MFFYLTIALLFNAVFCSSLGDILNKSNESSYHQVSQGPTLICTLAHEGDIPAMLALNKDKTVLEKYTRYLENGVGGKQLFIVKNLNGDCYGYQRLFRVPLAGYLGVFIFAQARRCLDFFQFNSTGGALQLVNSIDYKGAMQVSQMSLLDSIPIFKLGSEHFYQNWQDFDMLLLRVGFGYLFNCYQAELSTVDKVGIAYRLGSRDNTQERVKVKNCLPDMLEVIMNLLEAYFPIANTSTLYRFVKEEDTRYSSYTFEHENLYIMERKK